MLKIRIVTIWKWMLSRSFEGNVWGFAAAKSADLYQQKKWIVCVDWNYRFFTKSFQQRKEKSEICILSVNFSIDESDRWRSVNMFETDEGAARLSDMFSLSRENSNHWNRFRPSITIKETKGEKAIRPLQRWKQTAFFFLFESMVCVYWSSSFL